MEAPTGFWHTLARLHTTCQVSVTSGYPLDADGTPRLMWTVRIAPLSGAGEVVEVSHASMITALQEAMVRAKAWVA